MAKINEPAGKKTLKESISLLLQKNRVILLSILGAGLAALIILGVVTTIAQKKNSEGILRMEALLDTYDTEWLAAEDDEAKAAAEETIVAEIEAIIADFAGGFPAQKALFLRGDMAFQKEEWDAAIAAYTTLADEYYGSYLAPVALMHAATASEEKGDIEGAIVLFEQLVDDYEQNLEEVYRALFNIGRLNEALGNTDEALVYYNDLLDMSTDNPWASLAQTRVLKISTN